MSNAGKVKGSAWEKAIVDALKARGFLYVERRTAGAQHDRGDIAGLPGVVLEAKNQNRISLSEWVDEATLEAKNDGAWLGVVWAKRKGKVSADDGYVIMTGAQFIEILRRLGRG